MKLWFITRSFYPQQKTGGALIRLAQVENLKKLGWDITIVMPNYHNKNLIVTDNIVEIPFFHIQKLASLFEKIGLYEDYLDRWVNASFIYLEDKITQDDIIFSTTGGDLASVKLGSLLKKQVGCRFVVNFHDPIVYTLVNNLKVDKKPHISREKSEIKYISNSDLIITSSLSFKDALSSKYPSLKDKIYNNYFGYIREINLDKIEKKSSPKLRIAYSGSMSSVQKPELLYEAFKLLDKKEEIELYYIGDSSGYPPIKNLKNVKLIPLMTHSEFLYFMQEYIDVGFVSLASDYLGVCVPSKIYEYINLGLPILGALPIGDSMDIINKSGYGHAAYFDDINALSKSLEMFLDDTFLKSCKTRIKVDRSKWNMQEKIKDVNTLLKELL